jgi:hypothetical protein
VYGTDGLVDGEEATPAPQCPGCRVCGALENDEWTEYCACAVCAPISWPATECLFLFSKKNEAATLAVSKYLSQLTFLTILTIYFIYLLKKIK